MKKILIGLGIALAVIVILLSIGQPVAPTRSLGGNQAGEPVALIGSVTGTTTTGVYFLNSAGTTTYPFRIGLNADNNVTLTFKPVNASSSANASFNILASNDYDCDTATTTTIFNVPLATQINWYDAAPYLKEFAGSLNFAAATTTFSWNITGAGQSKNLVLTDVNSKCLAVAIHASSTIIHAQYLTK